MAPVPVVDAPLPLGSFEFALKTGPLRTGDNTSIETNQRRDTSVLLCRAGPNFLSVVALEQHLATTWNSSRLRFYGHSSALIWRGAAPQLHTARFRAFLDRAAAARAQLSHMSLPCLAGVDPQYVQIPDATRSSLIIRADALSLERQELQRCVFVSFGPPHEMQIPDASSSALIARSEALILSPHVLQRCMSVSFGPPHEMQIPDATRSARFARVRAFCSERQELQRIALVSVGMPHEMQSPEAARSALFALKGALCFSRQEVQR